MSTETLTALLLISLSGGYFFSVIFLPSLYYASRENGHRIYFRAVYYTFFLAIASVELYLIALFKGCPIAVLPEKLSPIESDHYAFLHSVLKTDHAAYFIAIFIFILGITLPHGLNYLLRIFKLRLVLIGRVIKNNEFEKMLMDALKNSDTILISQNNNKVYVGWVVDTFNPQGERKFLRFLPALSGYRDQETLEVFFTSNYNSVYEHIAEHPGSYGGLKASSFEVVIPADQITSIHLFDSTAFAKFQADKEPKIQLISK